jgi:uridine phosphorylase
LNKSKEYHIAIGSEDSAPYAILPGDPGRVPLIASFLENAKEIAWNREYRSFKGFLDRAPVLVTSTGIGCPSAAIAVEELIHIGVKVFLRVGTAGSLQENVKIGDLVISTGSVRAEGTTRQYVPEIFPSVADLDVTCALKAAARNLGFPFHTGITHCKDAFYSEIEGYSPLARDTENLWKCWENSRVLATSMESAAIFVISYLRGAKAGEILAIIGSTKEKKAIIKKAGIEEAAKTAVQAIRHLENQKSGKAI